MKQVLIGLIILAILFVGDIFIRKHFQPEPITTARIIFDTVQVENPDTIFITRTAEIEILDTLIIDTSRTDTVYAPIIHHKAKTDIEIGNWKVLIEYNTHTQKFEIDYFEFQVVIPSIQYAEKKSIEVGFLSTYFYKEKNSKFELALLAGFPRILNNFYIKFGAISDGSIGIGLLYVF